MPINSPFFTFTSKQEEHQPSTFTGDEANALFLELIANIQKIQTPGDELFNPQFTYQEKSIDQLITLIDSFKVKPNQSNSTAWRIPKLSANLEIQLSSASSSSSPAYSEAQLKNILSEKYFDFLKDMTGAELYNNAQLNAEVDKEQPILNGHVSVGVNVISPAPNSFYFGSFPGLTEKEKFQFVVAHEVGHFIQYCQNLQNISLRENYSVEQVKKINLSKSSCLPDITDLLEQILDFKPTDEKFGKIHNDLTYELGVLSREIYADAFSILISQHWSDTAPSFSEGFQSVLTTRKITIPPVFQQSYTMGGSTEPILEVGSLAYKNDYALSYLGQTIEAQHIDTKQLKLDEMHTLCQNSIVYGIIQVLYEASLNYPAYGTLLESIPLSQKQGNLFDNGEPTLSALFSILSPEDKQDTKERLAKYETLKKAGISNAYQKAMKENSFGEQKPTVEVNKMSPGKPEQLTLIDKINFKRELHLIRKTDNSGVIEVPKPISFKNS